MTGAVVLALIVVLAWWQISLRIHPNRTCSRCQGKGEVFGSFFGTVRALMRRRRPDDGVRTVAFGFGDTETVRRDVHYDIVDPHSQVTPDGTPVVGEWPEMEDSLS